MADLEIIAVVMGILIIITRLPALLWPKQFISYWKEKFSKESSAKTLGAIAFLVGLFFIYLIWNEISLLQLLVGGISITVLIIGLLLFLVPKLPSNIMNTMEKKLPLLRVLAFIAVLIGILLISLGYQVL
ncbi:MAG: hypothetical protein HY361_01715 [Candidatus Aenigmarchaeota archaeon]|nr:hypothetical protein [Candidatus Aenigmarchaeota archaeon]